MEHYGDREWSWYAGILSQAICHSSPGPILDVGAGNGLLLEAAARWGLDAEGVEGSREAIGQAIGRYPELRLRHHLLSELLPYEDESFQTVFMNQVVEHLEPAIGESALRETLRVLRPAGLLFLQSPSAYNRHEQTADPTHINLYEPDKLRRLLVDAGFAHIRAHNAPLHLLGDSAAGVNAMTLLFRMLPWQRLSATANFLAWKG